MPRRNFVMMRRPHHAGELVSASLRQPNRRHRTSVAKPTEQARPETTIQSRRPPRPGGSPLGRVVFTFRISLIPDVNDAPPQGWSWSGARQPLPLVGGRTAKDSGRGGRSTAGHAPAGRFGHQPGRRRSRPRRSAGAGGCQRGARAHRHQPPARSDRRPPPPPTRSSSGSTSKPCSSGSTSSRLVQRTDVGGIVASSASSIVSTGMGVVQARLAAWTSGSHTACGACFGSRRSPRTDPADAALPGTPAGPITCLLAYARRPRRHLDRVHGGGRGHNVRRRPDHTQRVQAGRRWRRLVGVDRCRVRVAVPDRVRRLERADGRQGGGSASRSSPPRPQRSPVGAAAIRAAVLPVSLVLGLGCIGIVIGERRRVLHDVAARTTVVPPPATRL